MGRSLRQLLADFWALEAKSQKDADDLFSMHARCELLRRDLERFFAEKEKEKKK